MLYNILRIYVREEGMRFWPGLGVMWDSTSKGFVLSAGKYYLWVRWSVRAKKWFVRYGKQRNKEFGDEVIFPVERKRCSNKGWKSTNGVEYDA